MTNDKALVVAIFWGISLILLYKWYFLNKKAKEMVLTTCKVSDTTLRTTYQKNIYIYYYTYIMDNEEYSTSDQIKYKLFFFNPKINDELKILVNSKNYNDVITPLQILINKIKLFVAITLIILPILLFI